jgi:hypothetical protein
LAQDPADELRVGVGQRQDTGKAEPGGVPRALDGCTQRRRRLEADALGVGVADVEDQAEAALASVRQIDQGCKAGRPKDLPRAGRAGLGPVDVAVDHDLHAERWIATPKPQVRDADLEGVAWTPAPSLLEQQPRPLPGKDHDRCRRRLGRQPLASQARQGQREVDRAHAHPEDHKQRSEHGRERAELGRERCQGGARLCGQDPWRDCPVHREHEQAVQQDRGRLRSRAAPHERTPARVAPENQPAAQAHRRVPEIGGQDDAEDQPENRRLERPARQQRHVDVEQVVHLHVGQGEDREDHQQDDVRHADDERGGDRGVQRRTPHVVEAHDEQHPDPRRRPDGRGRLERRRDAEVEDGQDQQAEHEQAHREDQGPGRAQVVAHQAAEVGAAVPGGAAARHGLGHARDRHDVDQAEQHQQRHARQRADARQGDGQGEDGGAHRLGQRQRVGGPERGQALEPRTHRGPRPAQAVGARHPGGEDLLEWLPVEPAVCPPDLRVVQPQGPPDAVRILVGEPVLPPQAMGQGSTDLRALGDQGGPLLRVALEILDGRDERRIQALREGREEGELPFVLVRVADKLLHRPARPGHQVGGPALDQKQQGIGPPGGKTSEEFLPVGEQVHLVGGHGSL